MDLGLQDFKLFILPITSLLFKLLAFTLKIIQCPITQSGMRILNLFFNVLYVVSRLKFLCSQGVWERSITQKIWSVQYVTKNSGRMQSGLHSIPVLERITTLLPWGKNMNRWLIHFSHHSFVACQIQIPVLAIQMKILSALPLTFLIQKALRLMKRIRVMSRIMKREGRRHLLFKSWYYQLYPWKYSLRNYRHSDALLVAAYIFR